MKHIRNKQRPAGVCIPFTVVEHTELKQAAADAGVPMATLIRLLAVGAVRRGETIGATANPAPYSP